VVGGLSVSTLLTLFLVPTVYIILEEWFPRKFGEEALTGPSQANQLAAVEQ
jgi:hypothetical protein